jgi:hypothetical protein
MASPEEAQLEAAKRELAELYKELAMPRRFSRQRVEIEMDIARVKKQIEELDGRA